MPKLVCPKSVYHCRKQLVSTPADGTAKGIGHFKEITAIAYHGGPGPDFLALWIYKYIACGMQEVLKDLTDFMN